MSLSIETQDPSGLAISRPAVERRVFEITYPEPAGSAVVGMVWGSLISLPVWTAVVLLIRVVLRG